MTNGAGQLRLYVQKDPRGPPPHPQKLTQHGPKSEAEGGNNTSPTTNVGVGIFDHSIDTVSSIRLQRHEEEPQKVDGTPSIHIGDLRASQDTPPRR